MIVMEIIASGLVATAALDLWQRLLHRVAGLPPSNWALVGRWAHSAARGRLFPGVVAQLPQRPGELATGWIVHYVVGVGYGLVYVLGLRELAGMSPSLLNGLVFGVLSVIVPWFFFMPAMGAGVLARNAPKPGLARLLALASHIAFGLGLALGAMAVRSSA